jgi:hypothetical protein
VTDPQTPQPPLPTPEPVTGKKPNRPRIVLVVVVVIAALFALGAVTTLVRSLSSAVTSTDPGSSQPVSYTSDEHGYTVEFPGEPNETTQAVLVNGANVDLDSAVWDDAGSAILASAAVFPEGMIVDVDGALDGAVNGAVGNIPGGAVTESEPIELAGMPARRAEATSDNGDMFLIAAFDVDGSVQFQLVTFGVDEATAQAFFDSFTLTG